MRYGIFNGAELGKVNMALAETTVTVSPRWPCPQGQPPALPVPGAFALLSRRAAALVAAAGGRARAPARGRARRLPVVGHVRPPRIMAQASACGSRSG